MAGISLKSTKKKNNQLIPVPNRQPKKVWIKDKCSLIKSKLKREKSKHCAVYRIIPAELNCKS